MTKDGSRESSPNRPAENWGRRDSIRAGSVTGPWRSAPRTPTSQTGQGLAPQGLAAPAAGESAPPLLRAPASAPHHGGGHGRRQPRRGFSPVIRAVAGGLLLAAAMVTGALLLRPGSPAPEAAAPAAVLNAPPPVPRPVAAVDRAALQGITGIRLRFGPDLPEGRRDAILAALAEAGFRNVEVDPQTFEVATSRVGYYRDDDRGPAEALAGLIAPVLGDAEITVRDYAGLSPEPEAGRLDLWLSGGS